MSMVKKEQGSAKQMDLGKTDPYIATHGKLLYQLSYPNNVNRVI